MERFVRKIFIEKGIADPTYFLTKGKDVGVAIGLPEDFQVTAGGRLKAADSA